MGLIVDLQPSLGPVLVVGGGRVAAGKGRRLAEAGFELHVVAPAIDPALAALAAQHHARAFEPGDLAGAALVLACTDDRGVNRTVGELARAAGIPVLVADAPAESTFHMPAVSRRGAVRVAISTDGAAPSVAKALREAVDELLAARDWDAAVSESAARRVRSRG